jgi:hypothetical protein
MKTAYSRKAAASAVLPCIAQAALDIEQQLRISSRNCLGLITLPRGWAPYLSLGAVVLTQRSCCCIYVVYHARCAVYADGGICLDILQNQWSPIYDVSAILTSIQVGEAPAAAGLLRASSSSCRLARGSCSVFCSSAWSHGLQVTVPQVGRDCKCCAACP